MSKSTVNDQLPESPASVTAKVVTPNGFQLLFTLRDTTGSSLFAKYEEFEKAALAKGWKPQGQSEKLWNKSSGFSTQASLKNGSSLGQVKGVGTTCAKCGAPALKKSGIRKDNSRWEGVFCSTGEESHKLWLS